MDNDIRCEKKTTVCRHSVSNAREAQALFEGIGAATLTHDYRALFVIETTTDTQSIDWRELTAEHLPNDVVVLDNALLRDRSDELTRLLGSEQTFAVYAREFDAGLFAALAGTVRQPGVLIWITRPLAAWARTSRYGRRLISLLDEMPVAATMRSLLKSELTHTPAAVEQDEMLAALREVCAAEGAAVAVVVGKRGRGKSTLLGRLAAELSSSGSECLITASYRGAIQAVTTSASDEELPFIAVDQVLDRSADILLVDEAANISLDLLKQWVLHFPTVILATTVDGYESAGRGFTVRFTEWLDDHRPDWRWLEPVHPWRWESGDSLEWFVDRLLLNTDESSVPAPDDSSNAPVFKEVSQLQLASDNELLQSVYALLREHHYQTSVLDLQHVLDAENLSVFVATVMGQCVAASLVAMEGELDTSLHEAIVAKERRLAHQLLPQLLAQTANQATALEARYARVLRIAVAPLWRRRRIASGLLQFIERTLTGSVDVIGASFADATAANAFWLLHEYSIVHQGYRLNPRSAARSLAVFKALDPKIEVLLQQVHRVYLDNHHPRAGDTPDFSDNPYLSDRALLARLVHGQRNVHDTLGAVRRFVGEKPDNANWLEQLYERLGCDKHDGRRMREKKLRRWLGEQTTDGSAS